MPSPRPPVPVEPELPYTPPPTYPPPEKLPDLPTGPIDAGQIIKDALADALQQAAAKLKEGAKDYAQETWKGIREGETVDVLHPTIIAETAKGKELVVADAKSRSWRTLVQGLVIDLIAAVVLGAGNAYRHGPIRQRNVVFDRRTAYQIYCDSDRFVFHAAESYTHNKDAR